MIISLHDNDLFGLARAQAVERAFGECVVSPGESKEQFFVTNEHGSGTIVARHQDELERMVRGIVEEDSLQAGYPLILQYLDPDMTVTELSWRIEGGIPLDRLLQDEGSKEAFVRHCVDDRDALSLLMPETESGLWSDDCFLIYELEGDL